MDKVVEVRICVGTYSYVMGGADLVSNIENAFPEAWKGKVRIYGVLDLPGCDEKTMKPPYASVGNKILEEATVEKIMVEVEKEMKNVM